MIYKIYKKIGETPLQALERYKKENNLIGNKFTYACRLDPMAQGVMFVLSDEDVHKKEEFTKKDKKYKVQVLFGIKTDTGDLLGKIKTKNSVNISADTILAVAGQMRGHICWKYPIFSGKTVNGRKLFDYYLKNEYIDIPSYEGEIKDIVFIREYILSGKELLENIKHRFDLLRTSTIKEKYSDFRKDDILYEYEQNVSYDDKFPIFEFELLVTSGVFMRTFAEKIGVAISVSSLAYSIERTEII